MSRTFSSEVRKAAAIFLYPRNTCTGRTIRISCFINNSFMGEKLSLRAGLSVRPLFIGD